MEIRAVFMEDRSGKPLCQVRRFGPETAKRVRRFHESFPEYQMTPLAELKDLAKWAGVASLCVKDESFRFGLNAFKVLGGSWAIAACIAGRTGAGPEEMTFEKLVSRDVKEKLGDLTFATATDGNHGRGVAWTANRLGLKSVVYMPKGSAPERLSNIRALGAEASATDLNYDDTVRLARAESEKNGWILVQDTAWPGYEEIPGMIMEGYTTMAAEAFEQLGERLPTHVFLQAGVGSMAAAAAAYFAAVGGKERPITVIVEPDQADCFYRTAAADDGKLHAVTGEMRSIMAGLCCGEPSPLAWEILRDYADCFISIPDTAAARGMRILGNPSGADPRVISGESGAAAFASAIEILTNPEHAHLREKLQLNADSRILCFSTEGDTDRENYRRIVWDAAYPASDPGSRCAGKDRHL